MVKLSEIATKAEQLGLYAYDFFHGELVLAFRSSEEAERFTDWTSERLIATVNRVGSPTVHVYL